MNSLIGVIERVTYSNEQTGWSVIKVQPSKQRFPKNLVTVIAHSIKFYPGATFEFFGNWEEHLKFGPQFKASKMLEIRPATISALEKYLGSGLIKGIGPKTAKRIVNQFKETTLNVFEENIDKLLEIDGIAKKKLNCIIDSWSEHKNIRDLIMFLQDAGTSTNLATKIFKKYGKDCIEIVKENPYQLAKDIHGVGFYTADQLALKLGFTPTNIKRIQAAILYVLSSGIQDGHVYLKGPQIIQKVIELIREPLQEEIISSLKDLVASKEICSREILNQDNWEVFYYSKNNFFLELELSQILNAFLKKESVLPIDPEILKSIIFETQKDSAFSFLSKTQLEVLEKVLLNKFFVLTGGPGCGKTTTLKAVYHVARKLGLNILLTAPTGRASQRMEEVIGPGAKTIHRLLEFSPQNGGFKKNKQNPLNVDLLIVDEVSMLDLPLATCLLRAVPTVAHVLFVGDKDQLPSVGVGQVLRDILECGKIPHVTLQQVFRQKGDSGITFFAHQVNKGIVPPIPSPFQNPGLWETEQDALFIDSEQATKESLLFLKKLKKYILDNQVENKEILLRSETKKNQFNYLQWVYDKKDFENWENMSEIEETQQEELQQKEVFSIPKKFNYMNVKDCIDSSTALDELKAAINKISPYSSLHYGITASEMINQLYKSIVPKYQSANCEIQILSPMIKGDLGTKKLNQLIQNSVNPKTDEKKEIFIGERVFREGDRIIQTKNNYELDVFNGDIGKIISIDHTNDQILVEYKAGKNKNTVVYGKQQLEEVDLAYSITIHKSQGSEFEVVIIPISTAHYKMLFRNLVYTGMTRAKKLLIFVGSRKALKIAVNNKKIQSRQTYLKELIC